jgi:fibronectin type 3 domain-containing protein
MKRLEKFIISNISILIFLVFFSGCAFNSKIGISQNFKEDNNLPTIQKVQTMSDMNAIAFEWIPLSDFSNIAGYKIYRLSNSVLINIATLNDKVISHFVDTNLEPNSIYEYRFSAFAKNGNESKKSNIIKAKTLPVIKPINYIIPVGNLPNKIKLLWRPHLSPRVAGYIIERCTIYNPKWEKIAEINNRFNAEFIDYGLDTNRLYKYRLRVKTFDNLISQPSKVVEVETKALPKTVQNIETTFDLPKQIRVSWQPSKEKDTSSYRIYRSFNHEEKFDLIKQTKDNFYIDRLNQDGKRAFYKISVVDKDGLESRLPELSIDGSSLRKPSPPRLIKIISSDKDITLFWESTDNRSLSYKIVRKRKSGWLTLDTKEFISRETKFVDTDVKIKENYSYQIYSIDRFGIMSKPTEESEKSLRKKEIK